VDSAWEQEKLEARKMLENAAESHTSGARFVSLRFIFTLNFVVSVPIQSIQITLHENRRLSSKHLYFQKRPI
jgi:hypothetical protein